MIHQIIYVFLNYPEHKIWNTARMFQEIWNSPIFLQEKIYGILQHFSRKEYMDFSNVSPGKSIWNSPMFLQERIYGTLQYFSRKEYMELSNKPTEMHSPLTDHGSHCQYLSWRHRKQLTSKLNKLFTIINGSKI